MENCTALELGSARLEGRLDLEVIVDDRDNVDDREAELDVSRRLPFRMALRSPLRSPLLEVSVLDLTDVPVT